MPDLSFEVTGIEPAARGLTPLLHFNLLVSNGTPTEQIQAVMVHAQIQIQAARRSYSGTEKEMLEDLFGKPDRWGQTLRNRLWTHASAIIRPFYGSTTAILPVQCTYDFNVIATKYFSALQGGNVPLIFLFSGTIFYSGPNGALQVEQISWDKECVYQMPASTWADLMNQHYPNSAWLSLDREIFDRLATYKRRLGILTWEEVIERLLADRMENP